MCGIVGWLSASGSPPDRAVLARMNDAHAHRGPDGAEVWVEGPCGLGHRRLSIVDLEGGTQPMATDDGRVVVTFNGEIYNHLELRRDLERHGHRFRTRSDTEVLVHGYRQWGTGLPARLNGMFAFAVWDSDTQTALLARDRMGQKPLYYAHLGDGSLVFGSELKSLLQHPAIERRADRTALALYLTYEYVPHPHSAIAGVNKLAPGDLLVWRGGQVDRQTYVTLPFGEHAPARTDREWIEQTRAALSTSVKRRLMADVPLGVFLSGGVDSSAIVALMCEHVPAREIDTFSIAFEEATFDESRFARMAAAQLGTRHHVETFSASKMLDTLPQVVAGMDEPFADASLLPTTLLSEFARRSVKVALGGDGGDELFCGYETFRADTAARAYRRLPAPLRDAFRAGVERLPVTAENFSLDFVLKSFVRGADAVPEFRHTRWLASFIPNTADDPLRPEVRRSVPDAEVFGVMAKPYLECRDPRHLQKLSYAYMRTYLAEDILTKVDRASMAHGLEVRSPFMDPELVSLVARMPPSLKLRGGLRAKHALKAALRFDLPRDILERKKKGFGVPVAQWLNGPLAAELDRLLAPERVADSGLLEPRVVARLIEQHRTGKRDNRKQLWTLMMLETWRERFDVQL